MPEKIALGYTALEHIRYLVETIGPRPAGSPAERRGMDYAAEQLLRFGYHMEEHPASFAPYPTFYYENILAGLLVLLAGWGWYYLPWLTFFTPLLLLLVPELEKWNSNRRACTATSTNIYAAGETNGTDDKPLVIFCAHVDSAPAMAIDHPLLVGLFSRGMTILQRLAVFILFLSLAHLIGFSLPFSLYLPLGLITSLVGLWFAATALFNQLNHQKGFTAGASDNASGVGLTLALAEHYSAEGFPKRLNLGFLITGAEETGLHGAKAFAQLPLVQRHKTLIVNLDMVGAGRQILVVEREGSLFTYKTPSELNKLLLDVSPGARTVWYSLKSGDFAAFLAAGVDAVSIQTTGNEFAEAAYHTINDNMNVIDVQSLEMVGQTLTRFVDMLPYSQWAVPK